MEYHLQNKNVCLGQASIVVRHGDILWEQICDTFNESFTLKQVTELPHLSQYAHATRINISRVVLFNVMAEGSTQKAEKPAIIRKGRSFYFN
jgi:hypothetical protein